MPLARTRSRPVAASTLVALLIAMEPTIGASDGVGMLEVWITDKDQDGALHPLAGVEIEMTCDRGMRFPRMRTDAAGKATIRAAYSVCKLKATSAEVAGHRSYLWTSHVEFSRTPGRLDLSSEDAIGLPVLIHGVDPVYPEALRAAGIVGQVVIDTVIRRDGTVGKMSVVSSSNTEFNKPAMLAMKQRTYEPALQHGWPVDVTLTETMEFGLRREEATPRGADEPMTSGDGVVLPVLIKSVEPVYPPDARLARIEGRVILQAVVDRDGSVSEASVQSTTNPIFNKPALEAVKRRKYEPGRKAGKPVAMYFTVRIDFNLR